MSRQLLTEKFIRAYLHSIDVYWKDYKLTDTEIVGDSIRFTTVSPCGHYREIESIELLDLMAWLWGECNE